MKPEGTHFFSVANIFQRRLWWFIEPEPIRLWGAKAEHWLVVSPYFPNQTYPMMMITTPTAYTVCGTGWSNQISRTPDDPRGLKWPSAVASREYVFGWCPLRWLGSRIVDSVVISWWWPSIVQVLLHRSFLHQFLESDDHHFLRPSWSQSVGLSEHWIPSNLILSYALSIFYHHLLHWKINLPFLSSCVFPG